MAVGPEPLVVWINGAFGVGKTSVAQELVALLPGALLFDPELLGFVLRDVVPVEEQTGDFQDIPAWRATTLSAVLSLARQRPRAVVVPMTLVEPGHFDEVVGGIRRAGTSVVHVTLTAAAATIAARLRAREADPRWALARVDRCVTALSADRFALHLDAESTSPAALAAQIADLVRAGA